MRIFLFAILLGWALPGVAQHASVAEGTHVNLRAGKTDNYRVIRVLPPQSSVEILEVDHDMAKVKTKEGETGWLPVRLLVMEPMDIQPPPTPETILSSSSAPAAMADSPKPGPAEQSADTSPAPWRLLLVGSLCFLMGAAVGIGLHEAYYRKRLNGLRI
jgi:hypothetical protein